MFLYNPYIPSFHRIARSCISTAFLVMTGALGLYAQQAPVAHKPSAASNKSAGKVGLRPVAKKQADGIYLLADGKKDSIILRWVPSTDVLWKMGNKYGYVVERFTVVRNNKLIPGGNKQPRLLTAAPLKPWSRQALDKLVEKEEYAGVLEEALYEADFNVQMKGESPSEILSQVQQAQNRMGFALLVCDFSPIVARAAALRFIDKKPTAGEKYIYRVRIALPDSLNATIHYQPGVTMRGPDEPFLRPSPQGLKGQFGNRAVALSWNLEMLHGIYTAFNIERSVNGGPFTRVNEHPFLQMNTDKGSDKFAYYVDSLKSNYVPYAYRIRGITPFGDEGAFSDTVRGEGLSTLDYRPYFDSIFLSANGTAATIRWTLPDSVRRNLAGIFIARAPKSQGPYKDINSKPFAPDQTEAIDPSVTGTSNYYRIRLMQKDGQQITSLPYYLPKEDTIPPAIPLGLDGVSDKKGLARIHWHANTEKDLKGYRLFRSQVKTGEYMEITKGPITDTAFTDTLNLRFTNPYVYYKVIALDHYYNSSDYSAPLAIRRPDTIPPVAIVFRQVVRKDTAVMLSFTSSPSDDVQRYSLFRYSKEDPRRQLVAVYAANIPEAASGTISCMDIPPASDMGKTLIYEVDAEDSMGNKAPARSGELFFETGFRKPVSGFTGLADRNHKKIKLSWKCEWTGVTQFVLYRAVNDSEKFMSYKVLPGISSGFEDTDLHISNTYKYKIKAVLKTGVESVLTKELTVSY